MISSVSVVSLSALMYELLSKVIAACTRLKMMHMFLAYSTADKGSGCLGIYIDVFFIDEFHNAACLHL